MQTVFFHSADRTLTIKNKKQLKDFVANIFLIEGKELVKADYIFCSDKYLLQINKTFLQHDYYTDIITFPLSEKDQPIEAEVYISLDRVKENASNQAATLLDESLRVLFHGVLHLCGYCDKTKTEQMKMRAKEDFYINLFHVKQ